MRRLRQGCTMQPRLQHMQADNSCIMWLCVQRLYGPSVRRSMTPVLPHLYKLVGTIGHRMRDLHRQVHRGIIKSAGGDQAIRDGWSSAGLGAGCGSCWGSCI